jgi:hypothetical protein
VKIFDNYLDKFDFDGLYNTIANKPNNNFSWYLMNGVVDDYEKDKFQFNHIFHNGISVNSPHFNLLIPILVKIKPKKILRIKINLQTRTVKRIVHSWHTDLQEESKTGIFYLNTCDGYTEFKKPKKKVNSIANRFVEFNSYLEHRGTTCTDKKYRLVLNFNYT